MGLEDGGLTQHAYEQYRGPALGRVLQAPFLSTN